MGRSRAMTIASNSHPGPTDNLPGKASHRQPTASNAITAGHRGSRVCDSIILDTAIFRTGHQTRPPDPANQKILPCECLDRLYNRLTKIVARPSNSPGTESWRDSPAKPVIRSDSNSSGSLLPPNPIRLTTVMKYARSGIVHQTAVSFRLMPT